MAKNKNLKILIIDDSDLSRKTISEILEAEGFNVVGQTESVEKALQLTQMLGVNLFIIDVVMPNVNGLDLAKLITENFKNVYIIMISSLNMESIVIEAITNGAVDFLQKPFTPEEIIQSVEKIAHEFEQEGL